MKDAEARLVAMQALQDLQEPYAVEEDCPSAGDLPARLEIRPNPSRGLMSISYVLNQSQPARLAIYDASGRQVMQLANGRETQGRQK
jgi:hypothetical protein